MSRPDQQTTTAAREPATSGEPVKKKPVVTRFAPSPTGYLHVGHAYSALFAWQAAHESGGRFLLRIEDIDGPRCRFEFTDAILEDLAWLGTGLPGWGWEADVRRQSEHMEDYRRALAELERMGLVYPCFCTRAQILAEVAGAAAAPHGQTVHGQDGPLYPGTCRALSKGERAARLRNGFAFAVRLDTNRALAETRELTWNDRAAGVVAARPEIHGDVVLARKDTPSSYHLSVTVDDHLQGVTLVTRGEDLFASTHVHLLLQALLGFATPDYHHHRLVTDETGKRFAKRDRALTIRALREAGHAPDEVRARAGWGEAAETAGVGAAGGNQRR
ncbi:MAG: tRNA glutamyl-Q(34) synthetase GluQRS [Alphaproteobacteria bacterium]